MAVLAPEKIRLARICRRDGISESDARLRMQIQPKDDFYISRADRVFYNDGTAEDLAAQVTQWLAGQLREVADEG